MSKLKLIRWLLVVIGLSCVNAPVSAMDIRVEGLLKNAIILKVDGKQRLIKVGQTSPEGILLLKASAKEATIEINGEQQQLSLSRQIVSNYKLVERQTVSISRNAINQYVTNAKINGKRQQVLVDTGANVIALSSRDADRLGIEYLDGKRGVVTTASGRSPSYGVKLRTVSVGGIQVSSVRAIVVEGDYPEMILLGMTFLQHVDMSEKNGVLYLEGKF